MKAEGRTVGVLGVGVSAGELPERETRVLEAVAAILARSLKTAHAFDAMRRATIVDQLTGCATRTEGLRRLEAELRRAERSRTSIAVLMLDLDHFKSINDRFGHNAGDKVLSAVGQLLLGTLRASDVRCRWGGEEFLIVLPESSVGRAQRASEALRERIAGAQISAGDHTVHLTVSIGVTVSRPGETDIQKLVERADAALYRAKSAGRNRVKVVLGDFRGEAVASGNPFQAAAALATRWTGPERRSQAQGDRRRVPSPGRRRTDPGLIEGPWRA
jgi:diguanylate cyclase (GGDEF)-like protein